MIEELALYSGRIAKIDGPARSGKTEVLVRRCAHLLEQGVDGASILVVVSSAFACARFRRRLECAVADTVKKQASCVVVSRAIDVCTSILDTPSARAATGRKPRVLNDSEYLFFAEDLKTLGQKNQRLSNMLLFFYSRWSDFEDEQKWLIPGEESRVLDHAKNILVSYKAMLRHEVPYVCGKFLLSETGKPHAQRYDYVFCDDFQNLSHAEQTCMCLGARKQVIACGNLSQTTTINTDYPYPQGFEKFERLRKNVDVFTLDTSYGIPQALQIDGALCATEERKCNVASHREKTAGANACFIEWKTPEDELGNLGSIIKAFCKNTPAANPNDIVIAVPNKRWGTLVQKALEQQGINSSVAGLNPNLGGDPRVPSRHDALTSYIKLSLVADAKDIVAWRALTGLDDALTNSEIWNILHKNAQEDTISLYDALKNVAENEDIASPAILKEAALKQAWSFGQAVIAQCRGLRGYGLAQTLGLTEQAVFSEVLADLKGDETAKSLCELLRAHLASPRFPHNNSVVHLALYENLCGLDYRCLIMPGMVDGMIPFRDAFDDAKSVDKREHVIDSDRKRLCSCLSKGTEFLIASTFIQTDIETAERAKLKVARIASIKGKRVTLLNRSLFFDEAGVVCPEFSAGDQVNFEHFFQGK